MSKKDKGKGKGKDKEKKSKAGRKKINLDIGIIKACTQIGSPKKTIALRLGISLKTLERRLKDDPDLRKEFELGVADFEDGIRFAQIKAAKNGSVPMLIRLGDIHLNQNQTFLDYKLPQNLPTNKKMEKIIMDIIKGKISLEHGLKLLSAFAGTFPEELSEAFKTLEKHKETIKKLQKDEEID